MSRASAGRARRVLAVFRHPTPYRDGLLDRAAELPGVDLEVLYLGRTFAQTPWDPQPLRHRHSFPRPWFPRQVSGHEIAVHPRAVARLLASRPSACVLSGWSDPTMVALAAACRALRIPYALVVESHGVTGRFTGAPKGLAARIRRAMVRGASSWLPAGSLATEHAVRLGADRERCHFFPTSPDARRLAALTDAVRAREPGLRASLGLPDSGVVLFVGRVVDDKAPDVLLDALQVLRERRPCRLVLVGDGPLLPALKAHPAADLVTFTGFLQPADVVRFLAACDVFALPSRYETWGAVATEALAAGVPVVLSDRVGCAPDLLAAPDPPGVMVPCGDAAALADGLDVALRRAAAEPGLRERAQARAFAWGHDLNLDSLRKALADMGVSPDAR